jgi:hypothetical protein
VNAKLFSDCYSELHRSQAANAELGGTTHRIRASIPCRGLGEASASASLHELRKTRLGDAEYVELPTREINVPLEIQG